MKTPGVDGDGRIVDARRSRGTQRSQEPGRVAADRPDALVVESLGEGIRHRASVGGDVRDAAGDAHVVLEDADDARGVANQVDAGDMDADAVGRLDALDRSVEMPRRSDQPRRDDAVTDGQHRSVHIREERLERPDPLGDAGLDRLPFGRCDHAGHDVERERAFDATDVEGDALVGVSAGQCFGTRAQIGGRDRP